MREADAASSGLAIWMTGIAFHIRFVRTIMCVAMSELVRGTKYRMIRNELLREVIPRMGPLLDSLLRDITRQKATTRDTR